MYTPLHLLPQTSPSERERSCERWDTERGQQIHSEVVEMIRKGAGEDFLQWKFEEEGWSDFLDSMWDLKGIQLTSESIDFPRADNFESIDFSFSSIYHCEFKNATFLGSYFGFARLYNCTFISCTFVNTSFFASTFEKSAFIGCDFVDSNRFLNSEFVDCRVKDWFTRKPLFEDCRFDNTTTVDDLRSVAKWSDHRLEDRDRADVYRGLEEAYVAGSVDRNARRYYFKKRQCITRYNERWPTKLNGYLLELNSGYGVYPARVFGSMLAVFMLGSVLFWLVGGLSPYDSALLSAGAFFTFGARADQLTLLPSFFLAIYVAESFAGIGLMALLVTVLARLWFSQSG